jgi:hypothetical protein
MWSPAKSGLPRLGEMAQATRSAESPTPEIICIKPDAKKVSGDESKLRCSQSDDANEKAVDAGNDPALPQFFAHENG